MATFLDESAFVPSTPEAPKPKGVKFLDESAFAGVQEEGAMTKLRRAGSVIGDTLKRFQEPLPSAPETYPDLGELTFERKPTFSETPGGAVTSIRRPKPFSGVAPSGAEVLSKTLGMGMQAADLGISTGKMLLGQAPYWSTRTLAKLQGESDKIASAAGAEAKNFFFPPEVSTPWARVAASLGDAAWKSYNDNPIAFVMGKISDATEHGAQYAADKTGLQKEDFMALAEQFMGSTAYRSMRPEIKRAVEERMQQLGTPEEARQRAAFSARQAPRPAEVPPEKTPYVTTPAENKAGQKRREAAADEMTMTPAKVKAIFTEAKKKPKLGEELAVTPDQVAEMFSAAKDKAPLETVAPTPLATGIEKVATELKYDLDPAEIAAVKAVVKGETPAGDWSFWDHSGNKGPKGKQAGFTDPEFIALSGLFGGPLVLAAKLMWDEYKRDEKFREWLNDPLHKVPEPEPTPDTAPGEPKNFHYFSNVLDSGVLGAMFVPVFAGHPRTKYALQLEKSGVPREQIWKQTGLFKGADGIWRREIDDSSSKINPATPKNRYDQGDEPNNPLLNPAPMFAKTKLEDVIEHPALFRKEADFPEMPVKSTGFNFGLSGAFDEKTNTMYLAGARAKDVRSTVLHELQHRIQSKYNMNRGGSPEEFLSEEFKKEAKYIEEKYSRVEKELEKKAGHFNPYILQDAIASRIKGEKLHNYQIEALKKVEEHPAEWEAFQEIREKKKEIDAVKADAYKQYKQLAGEAEARVVQARANLTPSERRARPPWEDLDVPERDLKVKFTVGSAAAIKPAGGNWHPEAIQRLVQPLAAKLHTEATTHPESFEAGTKQNRALHAQSTRMISGYLNKHAGTATDPLRDIEVPFGEGMKKWGELTDQAIKKDKILGPRGEEDQWRMQDFKTSDDLTSVKATDAIKNQISHIGDYLRQNVDPANLGQYDFVRAFQETAKNDARVAKEMEKSASASTAQLPVYKDYGDGMKWVELKLPEKLTEEQAKGVRHPTSEEWKNISADEYNGYPPTDGRLGVYVAVEGDKPIKNSYTQGAAVGKTPEEAWLAGRLAEEGNSLGHCVGGYCDAVASGEAKIYSLRGKDGKSHVTVEVAPRDYYISPKSEMAWKDNWPKFYDKLPESAQILLDKNGPWTPGRVKRVYPELYKQYLEYYEAQPRPPADITQIKGKQNRAPIAAYLPYVQDFVRSGKWGEVGDLENTGLQRSTNQRTKEVSYLTQEELAKAQQATIDKYQKGSIDPKLLLAVAAAGGLAAYLTANPDESKEVVAAGMLAATKGKIVEGIKTLAHGADLALGRSTTRLTHIDPQLTRNLRDTELAASRATAAASDKISSFITEVKKLPKDKAAAIDKAYMESDPHAIAEAIKGNPALVEGYRKVRQFLDETRDTLREFGRFAKGITEHLPRVVKDHKGLVEQLGHEERTSLENLMLKANKKMIMERGRELTDVERSVIINNFFQSAQATSGLPGFAKNRTIKMTEELRPFYYSMEDSLIHYAHAAVEDIATTRFFGKDLRVTKDGGKKFTNIDDSIGALTGRLIDEGKITPREAVEVQQILRARFGPGAKAPAGAIQDLRNITGIATLGQIGSGLIQTSEALLSVYHHDIRPAIEGAGMIMAGKGIGPKEFGLANHVIEETIGKRPTGQVLSGVLKLNLLAAFDQLGMKQNLTASYAKNRRLAQTEKGRAELQGKWGEAYGDDMPALIAELRSGKRGNLTDSLLYGELSDTRPTSRAEMPQLFNEHPNGRFLWQLKQFMISQADVLRRDAYDKIKTGEPRQIAIGLKNLTLYAAALSVVTIPADAIKNWIMGRDYDFDKIDYVENIARNFSLSRYEMNKVGSSDKPAKMLAETAGGMITPPMASVAKTLAEGVDTPKKLVPLIPLGGRAYYNRELGGNESFARSQAIQKRIEERDAREKESPYLKELRMERKRRREAKQAGGGR